MSVSDRDRPMPLEWQGIRVEAAITAGANLVVWLDVKLDFLPREGPDSVGDVSRRRCSRGWCKSYLMFMLTVPLPVKVLHSDVGWCGDSHW